MKTLPMIMSVFWGSIIQVCICVFFIAYIATKDSVDEEIEHYITMDHF